MLLAAASRGVWKPVKLHLKKRNSPAKKETETPTAELQPVLVALSGCGLKTCGVAKPGDWAVNTRRKEGPLPRIGWSGTRRTGAELAGSSAGDMPTTTEGRHPDGSRAGDGRTPIDTS